MSNAPKRKIFDGEIKIAEEAKDIASGVIEIIRR